QLKKPDELAERQEKINESWDRKLPGRGALKTLVLPSTYMALMMKEAYPGRSPGEHFWKRPFRALKFLSWMPSGSIRKALDPELDNQTFNDLWRQHSHGPFLAYVLPIIIVLSRLLFVEKLVDWWVNRYYLRQVEKLEVRDSSQENRLLKNDSDERLAA
ncbi:MAG: hypothetical protein AAGA30_18885, partial [Planctomycetota bacterium]